MRRANQMTAEIAPNFSPRTERVFGLDLLRATAIASVVCAHGLAVLYAYLPWWFGLLGHGGFYGVELFFVLSGFLIGRILFRKRDKLARPSALLAFYVRRWFRTLPLFFLFVAVNVTLESALRGHHLTAGVIATHALFLRNFADEHLTFFGESWSLAIEEWFYLLFPFALFLALRLTTKTRDAAFVTTALIFYLFSTALRVVSAADTQHDWAEWERKVVLCRFDALMIGIVAAWLAQRHAALWKSLRVVAALLGLGLAAVTYATLWKFDHGQLAFGADSFFARTFRFNLVSLAFALLLPWASTLMLRRETSASTAVRCVALWSYALYLVHIPTFDLVQRLFGTTPSRTSALLLFSAQIAASLVISALLYRYYEVPCTRLREKFAAS